ncbi:MAG: hypothetical protein ABJG41_12475 [Cyclobacteriaceae bacterium]
MANINVLVTVDTANITPTNLSTTVVLTDDNGDSDDTPGNSTTFDIHATPGQTVAFTIAPTGTSLVSFSQEDGVEVFSVLPSLDNGFVGTVSETVTGEEEFNITFKVDGNPDSPFTLDPVLKNDQGPG